ncbi:MAG: PAS domain-containing protein [Gammaproteobacteria bacterium]
MERPPFNLSERLWPRRLAYQVTLLITLLFSLGIAFFSVHVAREYEEFTITRIQQSGEVLAKNVSVTGSAYLFSTYYQPLEELLLQAADFPNVVELEILDPTGKLIRQARHLGNGVVKIFRHKQQYTVPRQIAANTVEQDQQHIIIWQPMVSGILQGWVRVEMDLEKLQQKQAAIYQNMLALGGLILLLILAAMLFYMRRPMQVLQHLTDFAGRLDQKQGETVQIQVGTDELNRLGSALNKVSHELQQQEVGMRAALQALELQKTALDHHSIVSITDVNGNISYANKKFCEVSGYTQAELLGRNHRIIKSGLHDNDFYKNLWETLLQGKVWKGEICNKGKNGKLFWLETTIVPFVDVHRKPYQYVAIRTDITALKHLTEELTRSQRRLEQSQAFANMGSWDWDIETGKVRWSGHVPTIFSLPEDVRETHIDDFMAMVSVVDRMKVKCAIDDCLYHGSDYDVEHRINAADGRVYWLHEKGNVIRDRQGRPLRMLGTVQDITARKVAENELRVVEKKMHESQKMEAIGTLAGGIAHDFNNILTAIMGYAELNSFDMQEGTETWDNQQEILVAARRAKLLVNQILLFSRKQADEVATFRPGLVVKEALGLLKTLLTDNVVVQCGHIDTQISVAMSSTQLHQAVVNLCVNAKHALAGTRDGRIEISLSKRVLTEALTTEVCVIPRGAYALLEVADNGCGIDARHLPHIFEPFFTTRSVGQGMGMGLSVVYGIVTKAQGAISVHSEPGKGSCFRLYFPLVAQTPADSTG